MKIPKEVMKFFRATGQAGGKAGTGAAKVRGDSEYYKRIRAMGRKRAKKQEPQP